MVGSFLLGIRAMVGAKWLTLLSFLWLMGCSAYQSDGRKFLEKDGLEFAAKGATKGTRVKIRAAAIVEPCALLAADSATTHSAAQDRQPTDVAATDFATDFATIENLIEWTQQGEWLSEFQATRRTKPGEFHSLFVNAEDSRYLCAWPDDGTQDMATVISALKALQESSGQTNPGP